MTALPWQETAVAADRTHHLGHDGALYSARFDEVLKFHAPGLAAVVHAVVLLLIVLFVGPLAARIPMATLAGILIMVAYHMSAWRSFARHLRAPRSDVVVLLATFLLTVLVDLTVAIAVGSIQ